MTISVAKRRGSDAHQVVTQIREKVEQMRGRLIPPEVGLTVTRDYGATAAEKAEELLLHLIVAIISVSIVIGLALGWRGALVVFISVPGLLHLDEEVEPVTIRLEPPRAERSSASDLGQVYLASMHQSFVPLSELVRPRSSRRSTARTSSPWSTSPATWRGRSKARPTP